MQDVIYEDVRRSIEDVTAKYTDDLTISKNVVDYIMGARSIDENTLSNAERRIYKSVRSYYATDMSGAVNEACSDVYGGVTNNLISGSYGHWPDSDSYDKFRYWYDSKGNATGAQSRELWAEFYSYAATGNEESMASLKEHFPSAYEYLVEMANSMSK